MNNLKKKIIAIVMTVSLASFVVGPGVAEALTAAELQAQIDALMAQLVALQAQLADLDGTTPVVTGCTISSFDRNLKQGMSGDDVKCLQIVLNTASDTQLAASGVGSLGNETSYFGPLTKAAVVKFQEKYASEVLASWGLTEGTGFVGSTTRAKLDELLTGGVIPPGCECTAWANDACGGGTCASTQMRQTRTCTPAACASESQCVADSGCEASLGSSVSRAVDSPSASAVAGQAQNVPFLKLKFTGGSSGYTVTKVIVTRGGTSSDADLSDITLYENSTRVGSAQALNTTTHKATFTGLSWEVPANSTKYLIVQGSINQIGTGYATTGNSVQLGISALSDITTTDSLTGSFPVWSAAKTIAGISVGTLDVDEQTTPADATLLSGSVEQEIAAWKIEANSTEGFNVHSIKVTQAGSATSTDVTNIKLKYAGSQIGSTVAALASDNTATFDLSGSPLPINASTSKILYAYADVASGIWTSRTIIFEVTEYTDVVAYGANSGGAVTITCDADADGTGGESFVKQTGNTMTIGQGSLVVSLDNAQNPADQTYVKGTSDRLMNALKFSTGSREGVRISELKLTLATGDATDIANVTLWEGTTQIAGPASVIGSYIKFGANTVGWDDPGVFDIPASTNKTVLVKADIPTGAAGTVQLSLANANVKADGLSSQYDIASGSITGSATGSTHTISAKGNLTVSLSSLAPSNQTYVAGDIRKRFSEINFTADSGEDIVISAVTVKAYASTDTATALTSGDISNVKLCNGVTESGGEYICVEQYGSTVATGSSSMSFSGALVVAASSYDSLTVIADIPTSTTADYVNIDVRDVASNLTDVTATGVSSSADIGSGYLTGSADANYMTIGSGALTVVAASTPGDQPVIINATNINYVGLVMTAGTSEDVRVTMIKLTRTSANETIGGAAYTSAAASDNDISSVALYDALGNRLTTQKNLSSAEVTFSASDFLNSTGIDILKGQQITIFVMADAPATADSGSCNALGFTGDSADSTYYDDIAATGLSSGTSLLSSAITLTGVTSCDDGINYESAGNSACNQVGLASAGALAVAENAGRPDTTRVAIGTATARISDKVVFYQADLTSAYEAIDVKSVTITRPDTCAAGAEACGRDADFLAVELYDGSVQLGSPQVLSSGTTTFNFPSGSYWRIPSGGTKTLTVKGVLNGASYATALPGDYAKLCIGATTGITGQGVDSGSTSITISGLGSEICGQEMSLATSVPTITVGTLPSTTLGSGTKTLYKWTVSADSLGAIAWQRIAFNVTGQASASGTIQTIGTDDTTTDKIDGLYTIVSGDGSADEKIADDGTFKVKRSGTNVAGTFYFRTDTDANEGTYVAFKPTTEETVAAGSSRTYTLEADLTLLPTTTGLLGSVSTRIKDLSSIYDADLYTANYQRAARYADVVINSSNVSEDDNLTTATTTNSRSFVWSDKSGCTPSACTAQTTHAATTYDWFGDYRVVGIPSTTLTLQ